MHASLSEQFRVTNRAVALWSGIVTCSNSITGVQRVAIVRPFAPIAPTPVYRVLVWTVTAPAVYLSFLVWWTVFFRAPFVPAVRLAVANTVG